MSPSDYVIPIVLHVIHTNGPENISDAQLLQGLQHLNDAFNNSGLYDTTLGVSVGIQFCLASQDESGNPTSGITRTQSSLTNVLVPSQDPALKNIISWNPTNYLNIWIVNEITSESAGGGVAGYAYFPYAHGSNVDGVVCEAQYFGSNHHNSKILIHELGHYLGLYHTFEGGCTNFNCLTDGDRVCDTPPDATSSPYNSCILETNSCASDEDDHSTNNPFRPVTLGGAGDQHDTPVNFMDYSETSCQIIFTNGQKERMISSLTTLRSSLLESKGCVDPCPAPIHIAFTPPDTSIQLGSTLDFINTTTGASGFEWYINNVKFSEQQNVSYTFNQQGSFTISLEATNHHNICKQEQSIQVKVNCNVSASFSGPSQVKPGESITFTNTTSGSNTYQWLIDGAVISSTENLMHVFSAGGYAISLVAFNGQCYDTSEVKFVQAGNCNPGNQGNVWHFGGWAGIDFSNDTIVPIVFPLTLPVIYHRSDEGCVSMSDINGNYLFFANPAFVFNKNKMIMPNGSGLLGHWSATQMAAVANPSNPDRYYLFTLDAFGGVNGFRYSEIDMTLDGGLGDVIPSTKNTLLLTPVTEKITTVRHANGIDTWVIVHGLNDDAFYSFLITSSGINTSPVISNTGFINSEFGLGQLKVSPDGCKLASALHQEDRIELFSFDNQTGMISSLLSLTSPDYDNCYSVEFSPDGSKLYAGMEFSKDIYQFDLNKTTASEIANSRVYIGNTGGVGYIGGFQLGPYGKIYIARNGETSLALINNPNAPGLLCNFVTQAIDLGGKVCASGLPAFTQSYFYNPKPVITGPDTICTESKNITYRISGSSCATDVSTWILKGKGSITSSNDTSAVIDFEGIGTDTLIVERISPCGPTSDTLFIVINKTSLDIEDTTRCSTMPVILDAGTGFTSYLWQDNSITQTFTATTAGKYWVTVTSPEGCTLTDTVYVTDNTSMPEVSLGADISICQGAVNVLDAGSGYTYEWQDHSHDQTFTAFLPGKYWVTITDICENKDFDTINIFHSDILNLNLGSDQEICSGEKLLLDAGSSYENYLWQDGLSGNVYTVTSPGTYWLIVTNEAGCFSYDSIVVHEKNNCCTQVEIPNLITPNNDGLNDSFRVTCMTGGMWGLEVYNRWGKLVYVSQDYRNEWAGDNVAEGIYYYLLRKDELVHRGWVQVTR